MTFIIIVINIIIEIISIMIIANYIIIDIIYIMIIAMYIILITSIIIQSSLIS